MIPFNRPSLRIPTADRSEYASIFHVGGRGEGERYVVEFRGERTKPLCEEDARFVAKRLVRQEKARTDALRSQIEAAINAVLAQHGLSLDVVGLDATRAVSDLAGSAMARIMDAEDAR